MGKVVIEPATIDQKRNWFLQISNIHCVRYRWEFSCIQKKDQYISTISHAKDRTTKSRQGHCTHREGQVAVCRVLVVTAASEIPVTEAPYHDGKGRKTQGCCSETVHNNVNNDFPGENTLLYLWRSVHNLQCGDLHAQTCAIFLESKYSINFSMLSKIQRPSFTTSRIEARLSSVKIISEASLATSNLPGLSRSQHPHA